jgi:hypothetical protein
LQPFLASLTDGRSLFAPLGGWLPARSPHKRWNFRLDPCGGLWKYDDALLTFSELKPYACRKVARRGKFFKMDFVEPVEFVSLDDIATWRIADVIDRGHYSRPTMHFTVPSSSKPSCHSEASADLMPCLYSPATAFERFQFLITRMD